MRWCLTNKTLSQARAVIGDELIVRMRYEMRPTQFPPELAASIGGR
jgi:hypothetical protein